MQRLTARFLLLFTLFGTFVPLAIAVPTARPHACCLRKAAHQCHGTSSDQLAVSSTGCCNHDCCRAVTTSRSAHPEPARRVPFARNVDSHVAGLHPATPSAKLLASQS